MGASVGLLTAAHDGRVRGVFAMSPYENAYDAVGQFTRALTGLNLTRAMVPPELEADLRATDVRAAVAGRDDLRIKLICGSDDCFPPAMQRRILAASASPAAIKSLSVGEGYTHFNIPAWDGATPLLLKFLDDVLADAAKGPATRPTSRSGGRRRGRLLMSHGTTCRRSGSGVVLPTAHLRHVVPWLSRSRPDVRQQMCDLTLQRAVRMLR